MAMAEILGEILRIKTPVVILKRILISLIIILAIWNLFVQRTGYTQQILSQETQILNKNNFTGSIPLPKETFPWDGVPAVTTDGTSVLVVLAQNYLDRGPNPFYPENTVTTLNILNLETKEVLKTDTLFYLSKPYHLPRIGEMAVARDSLLLISNRHDNSILCLNINKLLEGIEAATFWKKEFADFLPYRLAVVDDDYVCVADEYRKMLWVIPIDNPDSAQFRETRDGISDLTAWDEHRLLISPNGQQILYLRDANQDWTVSDSMVFNYGDRPGQVVFSEDKDTLRIINLGEAEYIKAVWNKEQKEILGRIGLTHNPQSRGLLHIPGTGILMLAGTFGSNSIYADIQVIQDDEPLGSIFLANGSLPLEIVFIPDGRVAVLQFGTNKIYIFSSQESLVHLQDIIPGPAVTFEDIQGATQKYSSLMPGDIVVGEKLACIVYPQKNQVLVVESGQPSLVDLSEYLIDVDERLLTAAFSNNERRLYVCSDRGRIYVIDIQQSSLVNIMDKGLGQDGQVEVASRTGDRRLYTGFFTGSHSIFEVITNGIYPLLVDTLSLDYITEVAVSEGDKIYVAGTEDNQGVLNVYSKVYYQNYYQDIEVGPPVGPIATITTLGKDPSSLVSVNGQYALVATQDGLHRVDLVNQTSELLYLSVPGRPVGLALNPEKSLLFVGFDNGYLAIMDSQNFTLKSLIIIPGLIADLPMYVSPNGQELLVAVYEEGEYRFRAISIEEVITPQTTAIFQNYPNPFGDRTIFYTLLDEPADVTIDIYNILGQRLKSLSFEGLDAGKHYLTWDLQDRGDDFADGVYFARLKINGKTTNIIKILHIKGLGGIENKSGLEFAHIDYSNNSNNRVLAGLLTTIVRGIKDNLWIG